MCGNRDPPETLRAERRHDQAGMRRKWNASRAGAGSHGIHSEEAGRTGPDTALRKRTVATLNTRCRQRARSWVCRSNQKVELMHTAETGVLRSGALLAGLLVQTFDRCHCLRSCSVFQPHHTASQMARSGGRPALPWPLCRNSAVELSSPAGTGIPRGTGKFRLCCPAQLGAPAVTFVVSIAIEAAMVRARKRKTETNNGDHRYLQEVRR